MRKRTKKFHKVNIEISNICNLQCSFCPEVIRAKKIMSIDLFKNIIEQVAPLTELVCFHLMGEPLVHKELENFIEICKKYNTKIFLVSNGVLLKPHHDLLLTQTIFHQVNFSLHSFFDNYPDKNPDRYLENIFHWTVKAFEINPELYINYRLWNLDDQIGQSHRNLEMLQKIKDFFKIDFSLNPVNVKSHKSLHLKNRLYLHFDSQFIWPSLDLSLLGTQGTCYGLQSHIGILVDGTVVPCCLDKEGQIPLGNLNESSLQTILDSENSQIILKGFKNNKLVHPLCQRCQYIERFK